MPSITLHLHPKPSSLAALLDPYLPLSLPIQNALRCTPAAPVWATFPPGAPPAAGQSGWLVLIDNGNQLRFFTPAEGSEDPLVIKAGEEVVVGALREMLRLTEGREGECGGLCEAGLSQAGWRRGSGDGIGEARKLTGGQSTAHNGIVKIGGFHECWLPALQRAFVFLDTPGMYRTFLPRDGEALAPAPPVPDGITVGPVRAEDIDEVRI